MPPLDIFLHIPKAGGITMYQILEHNYPPGSIWKVYPASWENLQQEVGALPEERRARLRLVTGHIPYGVHTLLERPGRYFTILREPGQRTLSYFHYVRSHADNPQYAETQHMSLEEYVESGLLLDNGQVRWLANVPPSIGFQETTSAMLETAKQNLKTLAAVGLLERYDESLLVMKHVLGWRWLWYRKRNVNRQRELYQRVPDKVRQRILEIHALDVELYRYAQTLFEQQIARIGQEAVQRERAIFIRLNRLYALASRLRRLARVA